MTSILVSHMFVIVLVFRGHQTDIFFLLVYALVCLTSLKIEIICFSKTSSFRSHAQTDHSADPGYEEMLEASVELRELKARLRAAEQP